MANEKISQLTNGNPALVGDQFPINRGGANFSVTAESVALLGVVKQVVMDVTSAQILSLSGGGTVSVVPGIAGKLLSPVSGIVEYLFVTTPYTLGGAFALAFGNTFEQANPNIFSAGLIDQSQNTTYDLTGAFFASGNIHSSALVGTGLSLTNPGTDTVSAGDGTFRFTINYVEYTLA